MDTWKSKVLYFFFFFFFFFLGNFPELNFCKGWYNPGICILGVDCNFSGVNLSTKIQKTKFENYSFYFLDSDIYNIVERILKCVVMNFSTLAVEMKT